MIAHAHALVCALTHDRYVTSCLSPSRLLRGVALVVGPGAKAASMAANFGRVITSIIFFATYTSCPEVTALITDNGVFVLAFAFALQEFLLNFQQYSKLRSAFALLLIAVTAVFSWSAYQEDVFSVPSLASRSLIISIVRALIAVNASATLLALGDLFQSVELSFLHTVTAAVQSFVTVGVVPILAVALFSHEKTIFGDVAQGESFLESSAASALMVTLAFILTLDGYITKSKRN
jgi:hypothetical protein